MTATDEDRQPQSPADAPAAPPSTSPVEWLTAAAGFAVVAAMVGYLAFIGWSRPEGPPAVEVSLVAIVPQKGHHLVRFEARNEGNSTAAGLVVEGRLERSGEVVETAQVTIDYLPQQSVRDGGLFFDADPSGYELVLAARGYMTP
ncbi:TIGR02588 family protein [Aurantimonas sp. 22II-16-19i]|uniref:TIGR02588 family protein n=1 Tax=Aurantimonas sp. 22II-16-19i TaxID=1317114 RepID=UPI0009F7CA75|nr:TIGR02588 family protein [Aurantimonas sp. 22II-16-19i]ORE98611.1 hypothetical protein ATO4_03825 [Aurantimonas sp. 22II-16-19i]